MNKARITYRFDDQRTASPRKHSQPVIPLSREEFSVVEETRQFRMGKDEPRNDTEDPFAASGHSRPDLVDLQPLNQFTTDFGAWSSPFDAETERIERLIRESGRTGAPPQSPRQSVQAQPERPLPERMTEAAPDAPFDASFNGETGYYGPDIRELPSEGMGTYTATRYGTRYERHHNRAPWLKIVTSVAGAVATGVLIGFFVLSMFGGDGTDNGSNGTLASGGVTSPAGGNGANSGGGPSSGSGAGPASGTPPQTKGPAADSPVSSAGSGLAAVQIGAKSYTLLQNGVFTNEQGANTAAAELKKKGLAAHVQLISDKFYVYAGISPNRDEALALSEVLRDPKTELMLKTMSIPAAAKIKWSGSQTEPVSGYFTNGRMLMDTIGGFAATRLKETAPSAMDDATIKSIRTAHMNWSGAAAPFGAGLAQEHQASLQKMNTAMNIAVNSMEEYKKHAVSSYLWQAETALMQYMFAESELLAAIAAQ